MDTKCLLSGLTLRLLVVGVPKHTINPFAALMCKWVTCSGEEWTVKRLKALKQLVIHLRSGTEDSFPLARNRRNQYKGVVGYLLRWALKSDNNFYKVVNAFMAYSNWTSRLTTKAQRKKFLQAVQTTPRVVPEPLKDLLRRSTRKVIQERTIKTVPSSILLWRGSDTKRAPTLYGSKVQSEQLLYELMLVRNEKTWEHIQSLWPIYKWVFKGVYIHQLVDELHEDVLTHHPMQAGEVHFLQEPGYKLRSIASPFRLFQVASEPLKDDLKKLVLELPWDCTHNQGRAFQPVQEALSKGRKVHSVDLSSATDYFPLDLQITVLETVYGKDSCWTQLVRDISRAYWESEIGMVRWTQGQPLGFNPSFFLFTLTHGLLLYGLNGCKWNHDFYVVGDDVVILNDTLYHQYIRTLSHLGCPYSPDKSISSDKLAEFAGKLILPDMVIPQMKWRDLSDDNFLDLARVLGPRIRNLLSKRQNQILNVFAHIPDFIHPYGLNWSYKGSTLEGMVRAGLELSFEETVLSSLTGLSKSVHKQLYADYGYLTRDLKDSINPDEVRDEIRTFDEKVRSVFLRLGYARRNFEYFLEGLKDIPEAHVKQHAVARMLPLETRPPSRETLVQRLSRFLKNRKQGKS